MKQLFLQLKMINRNTWKSMFMLVLTGLSAWSVSAQSIEEGRRRTRNEQYEDAEKVFNDLIALKPKLAEAYFYAGENQFAKGSYAAAKEFYQKGLTMNPKATINNIGLAKLALVEGKTSEAESFMTLATAKVKKKQQKFVYIEAARAYLQGATLNTANAVTYANIGKTWIGKVDVLGMTVESHLIKGDLERILQPTNAGVSLSEYLTANLLNQNDVLPLIRKAEMFKALGNFENAHIDLNKAFALDPDFAPAYRIKADVYKEEKKADSAVYFYRQYLSRNNNPSARRYFVEALYQSGKFSDAVIEGESLMKVKEFPNLYGIMAFAIAEDSATGPTEAMKGLNYIEQYQEKYVKTQNRAFSFRENYIKGLLFKKSGQDPLAMEMFKLTFSDNLSPVKWIDEQARYYYSKGNYSNAIELYNIKQNKQDTLGATDRYFVGLAYYNIASTNTNNARNRNEANPIDFEHFKKSDKVFEDLTIQYPKITETILWRARIASQIDTAKGRPNAILVYENWMSKADSTEKANNKADIATMYVLKGYAELGKRTADAYNDGLDLLYKAQEYNYDESVAGTITSIENYLKSINKLRNRNQGATTPSNGATPRATRSTTN